MNKSDWFVCLNYGKYVFLLPHEKVLGRTPLVEKKFDDAEELNFDKIFFGGEEISDEKIQDENFLSEFFLDENFSCEKKSAVFFMDSRKIKIVTSSLPQVLLCDLTNFKTPGGALKIFWEKMGVESVSFSGGIFSVLLNPEILFDWWSKKND